MAVFNEFNVAFNLKSIVRVPVKVKSDINKNIYRDIIHAMFKMSAKGDRTTNTFLLGVFIVWASTAFK
jgi:hypothetical protein